jgi:hypothetical protein
MDSIRELLSRLDSAGVEYVVVGGVAARLHGSTLVTDDLDVCCPMSEQNMARLIQAIGGLHPRFRFHPKEPPLPSDPGHLSTFHTLNLSTDIGNLDVLDQITGVGDFDKVLAQTITMEVDGRPTRVLDLDPLIAAKRAVSRDKDKLGIMHLEAVKKRREHGAE